jgi:hypothetical protein
MAYNIPTIKIGEKNYVRIDMVIALERISDGTEGVIVTLVGGSTVRTDFLDATTADLKFTDFKEALNLGGPVVDVFSPNGGWI